jgi:hypothetical protein
MNEIERIRAAAARPENWKTVQRGARPATRPRASLLSLLASCAIIRLLRPTVRR